MLTNEHMRIINAHKLPVNINPSKWVVCWEDKDVLEIVNSRHRRMRFEKKGIKKNPTPMKISICEVCGKEFTQRQCRYKKTCSNECRYKLSSIKQLKNNKENINNE